MITMSKFARIIDSTVWETFTVPENFTLAECFTPEVAALFEACPDNVEQNWIRNADGTFNAPPEPVTSESESSESESESESSN